ncbi:MAG: TIR domain-containing protein [Candidatus Desulfofervidaceae bacterium]|nr:TIR domain-containing protein [Candidatus Desulfofervidaceae bacterium]
MEQDSKLKLFISYSHEDNIDEKPYIKEFIKHLTPLKKEGLVEEWYDRKNLPGKEFQDEIDKNLENSDIICLFISANYLASPSCEREKKKALKLRKEKGILVIPIILSPCGWLDDKDISKLLALPTDGKPITTFENRDEAWLDGYTGLKEIVEEEIKIRKLKLSNEFEKFLQDTEMLIKAHSKKERVFIDDIFVYPELDKYDDLREYEETISSKKLIKNILDYPKLVIAGEELSGKTTICKIIFKEFRNKNFIPIYISTESTRLSGKLQNKVISSFYNQYKEIEFEIENIDKNRIVLIIDDFHLANNKEKIMEELSIYPRCIIIVDDIFSLNIRDEKLISSFSYFKIKELKPSFRYELIKKWVNLTDKETIENYKNIDKHIDLINATLGRTIGKGVMPAYPFFILSAMVAYEIFTMPLDQEITSQGYCYQALIYFYLRKNGVKNDEIDIYINFLTELAFYIYKEKKYELSQDEFEIFMNLYTQKYNLPIKQEIVLRNLKQIFSLDSFNNYSFRYPYIYYFFVAKYLVEHIHIKECETEIKREIETIINNLHVNEYAYIAVFMIHHSKELEILEEIILNALCLFDKYKPATLTKDEIAFFDKQADIIVKAILGACQ